LKDDSEITCLMPNDCFYWPIKIRSDDWWVKVMNYKRSTRDTTILDT